jgi:DNA-binding NarL/FixJ family response regulator
MPGRPVRVLIADDHPVVRAGLQGLLSQRSEIEVVGEATNGAEAVELAGRLRPDVVLMDLRMPGLDGVAAIRRVRAELPDVKVIVLTTYDSDADILEVIEAGAAAYLLKDAPREELFRAIHAAVRDQMVLAPTVASRLAARSRLTADQALSGREIEVLRLVAGGSSNREIASRLWISEATVKTHLLHVFGKLGVSDRTAAVTAALDRGIIRLGHDDRA